MQTLSYWVIPIYRGYKLLHQNRYENNFKYIPLTNLKLIGEDFSAGIYF